MPELPELTVFEARVREATQGRSVEDVEVADPSVVEPPPEELARRLEGASLGEARRHGKLLFLAASGGGGDGDDAGGPTGWIRFHFGMTGRPVAFRDPGELPEHGHLRLHFVGGGGLAFVCPRKLGEVGWVESPEAYVEEKGLGPDPLREGFGEEDFLAALEGRRGMAKTALMDQGRLAGIGNVYSDEILFQLRLHPRSRLPDLDEEARRRLWRATREVLERAAETLLDRDMAEEGRAELPEGYLLRAMARDEPCPRCGEGIRRVKVSGRNARHCPECQSASRSSSRG